MARRRVWFLRNGQHLCRGLAGVAASEYGDRTVWLRLPGGVAVWASRPWRYEEVEQWAGDDAPLLWAEWAETRKEDGVV